MSIKVYSAMNDGTDSILIQVECNYMRGFNGITLVGHTGEVCRSGIERVKGALESLNYELPQRRIALSTSPADLKKDGSHFDLAFAVALMLLLTEDSDASDSANWLFVAELGLNGQLHPVRNVISYALSAVSAGLKGIVVAKENTRELAALTQLKLTNPIPLAVAGFSHLSEVEDWLTKKALLLFEPVPQEIFTSKSFEANFDDMLLSPTMTEVAMLVAAGKHSLLMYGSPGTGKSMFSARLPSIFPKMEGSVHLQALKIHSSATACVDPNLLAGQPTYRSPHHQASAGAILGRPDTPGEISLAHGGVLFLDELPEFRRDIIESLREPLETKKVRVSRAKAKVEWEADTVLIAACNLCPCGWFGSKLRSCSCPTQKVIAYRRKLSGPILDRIDLHVNMEEVVEDRCQIFCQEKSSRESKTDYLRTKVHAAIAFAAARNQRFGVTYNSELRSRDLVQASGLNAEEFEKMIEEEIPRNATFRSLTRALRVARSLADLQGKNMIRAENLAKAWSFQADSAAKKRGDYALGLL